jgi:hypothetical protein
VVALVEAAEASLGKQGIPVDVPVASAYQPA